MAATIADIRAELPSQHNRCLRDYQIRWWIEHKGGCRAAVLKTIANQSINVQRVCSILEDPVRLAATHCELNRRVLNIIRISQPQRRVLVFINTRNKAETFEHERAVDALLTFLYYLQHVLETFLGDGGSATAILHMIGAPLPSLAEMRSQGQMMGATVGRSFPGIFDTIRLCCSWNSLCRRAACAAANRLNVPLIFSVPTDLISQFGEENLPTLIGGQYNLEKGPPTGDLVFEYLKGGTFMDRLGPLLSSTETPTSSSKLVVPPLVPSPLMPQAPPPPPASNAANPRPPQPTPDFPAASSVMLSRLLLPAAVGVAAILLGAAPLIVPAMVAMLLWAVCGRGSSPAPNAQGPADPSSSVTTISWTPSHSNLPSAASAEPEAEMEHFRRLACLENALLSSTYAECSFHLNPIIAKYGSPPVSASAAALALGAGVSPAAHASVRRQWALAQTFHTSAEWHTTWASLDTWLTAVTQAEITCACGCGQQGPLEALAEHIWATSGTALCSVHDTPQPASTADSGTPRPGVHNGAPPSPSSSRVTLRSRSSTESSVSGGDSSDPGAPPPSAHCNLCHSLFRPLTRRKHQCAVCARQYCSKCTATPAAKSAIHSKAVVCWPCASQLAPPASNPSFPTASRPPHPHSLRSHLFLSPRESGPITPFSNDIWATGSTA